MSSSAEGTQRKRWALRALLLLGVLGILGGGGFAVLFSTWSELEEASPAQAADAFAEALGRAGGGAAYLEISAAGEVSVRRELEGETPAELAKLHLLAWQPARQRLVRIAFPYWFVRVKLTRSLNLGTLTTALARDWDNLDLRVTEEDLARRGHGLVLDHERLDGSRILLWNEAAEP